MNNLLVIYPAFLDFQEIVIILVVTVVLFGPDKIPEIARGFGSAVRKLKQASEDIKQEIMNPIEEVTSMKDLNPMDEIEDSFKKVNPMEDFQKSFDEVRNPINEIDDIIKDQSIENDGEKKETNKINNEEPNKEQKSSNLNEPTIEKTKPEEKTSGFGGSVSR